MPDMCAHCKKYFEPNEEGVFAICIGKANTEGVVTALGITAGYGYHGECFQEVAGHSFMQPLLDRFEETQKRKAGDK